ncbi:MAG TPA: hypothetical protein DEQ34_05790 [Balneolaceae bacterium]|nr:hypothetical protein [Balneolaceae bacterium]|tara:strand:- start:80929 stop:81561 length:633 start_codon:yes stop_codon:yes gene_type:complete
MPQSDILKLVFHHDQRLDELAPSANEQVNTDPLTMFTKPDPTYSTLYFSGTDLESGSVGIDQLTHYDKIMNAFDEAFDGMQFTTKSGGYDSLKAAIGNIDLNDAVVISDEEVVSVIVHSFSHQMLRDVLEKGWIILYKREAPNGFDLHIFTRKNIYTSFFYPLQKLLPDSFRFFSINGKRLKNEKQFFFETWTLHKPPHGFEEVHPETVL